MNFQNLLEELREAGFTVQKVADDTGIKPSTISALRNGQNSDTVYSNGIKLIELHSKHCPDSKLLNS